MVGSCGKLGSLLQWRWQWASIGHFVFLFYFWNLSLDLIRFQRLYPPQIIWVCPDIWVFSVLDNRLLSDIWVFCQKCYFEVKMDCKEALLYFHVPVHDLQASEEIFMDIYMCCFIATLGAVGNFLLHASMEQIRVFVAKSTLSRIRTFLVFIGLRFYSDIWAKKWRVKPLLCYSVGNEHFVTSWWPAVTPL